jgi:hypothetical protein
VLLLVAVFLSLTSFTPLVFAQSRNSPRVVQPSAGNGALLTGQVHPLGVPALPPGWVARPPIHIISGITAAISGYGYTPTMMRHAYGFDQVAGNGAGQVIAIVDAYGNPTMQQDLDAFCASFGIPSTTLQIAYPEGKPTAQDTDWAEETSLDVEWAHAIAPGAQILLVVSPDASASLFSAAQYAGAHASQVSMSWGGSEYPGETSYDTIFNIPGVAFFASSGDDGAGVQYPAASPYVTGVGGTTLNLTPGGDVISETAWSGSGGGVSAYEAVPAFQTEWQTSASREVPDVSYDADPNTGVPVAITMGGTLTWMQVGGTSAASPQWAALWALANAASASAPSSADAYLYTLGSPATFTAYFRDITVGSSSGAPGNPARTGYDMVTGIGTPIANAIVHGSTPTVVSTFPLGPSVAVAVAMRVGFSNPMNQSATDSAFSISPKVDGTFSWSTDGKMLIFTPTSPLDYAQTYTVKISGGATNAYGGALGTAYSWSFTTAPALSVLSSSPAGTSAPVASGVAVSFSNPMSQLVTEGAFRILPNVEGAFSWSADDRTLTFAPTTPLATNTAYTVTVSAAAMDQYGNKLGGVYSWSFTTTAALSVVSCSPTGTSVSVASTIAVSFNNPMSQTATQGALSISPKVSGTFGWSTDSKTLTFTPTTSLTNNTAYTVTVSTAATEADGRTLGAAYQWSFTTAPVLTVVSNSPTGTNVAVASVATVSFSNSMSQTVTQGAFSISPNVGGAFSWSSDGKTLTFTPTASLTNNTAYTVTVSTAATDQYGTNLGAAYSWGFTTVLPPFTMNATAGAHLIGVPATPAASRADQVLGTTSVAAFDASAQTYQLFTTTAFSLSPGMGCWVSYAAPTIISFVGTPVTGSVTRPVLKGWNLLADPTTTALNWTTITADGSIGAFGWKWDSSGGGYVLLSSNAGTLGGSDVVNPWEGFWLLANANCNVTLGSGAGSAAAKPAATLPVAWAIRLSAAAGGATANGHVIGLMTTATAISAADPPVPGSGFVDLYSVGSNGERNGVDLVAAGGKTMWNMVAQTDLPNVPVTITFPDLSGVPNGLSVTLRDMDAGRTVNMRTACCYSFTSGSSGVLRHLQIEVKPQQAQAATLTSVSTQSVAGKAQVVYTLSAAADVQLQVFNIAGRTVASIPIGYCEAGTHTTLWSGLNTNGSKVPAGNYLLQVGCKAGDGTASNRIVSMQIR